MTKDQGGYGKLKKKRRKLQEPSLVPSFLEISKLKLNMWEGSPRGRKTRGGGRKKKGERSIKGKKGRVLGDNVTYEETTWHPGKQFPKKGERLGRVMGSPEKGK